MPTTAVNGHTLPGAGRIVLVLDDEADVRKLVSTMLMNEGYKVLTADNGEGALRVHGKSKQPVDLLLLDVVSPGMSGPMVADRITEKQPELPVLYMSGYGDTMVVQRYVVDKGHALLAKPFTAEQLSRKVAEVLESGARLSERQR